MKKYDNQTFVWNFSWWITCVDNNQAEQVGEYSAVWPVDYCRNIVSRIRIPVIDIPQYRDISSGYFTR